MSSKERFGIEFLLSDDEIYLDSATIGKLPVSSLQTMNEFYTSKGGGVTKGTHNTSIQASNYLEIQRDELSKILEIKSSQLSFLPSRETALVNALFSLDISNDNNVITSVLEDHSILAPLIRMSNYTGSTIKYLDLSEEIYLFDSLQNKITSKTSAVVLSAQTLGIGVSRDWGSIAKICKDLNVPFILDISYAIGHQPFNFDNISPDLVVSSGSIGALGPQGTAFQIIATEIDKRLEPILVGSGAIVSLEKNQYSLLTNSNKYEPGVLNIAGIAGMVNSLILLNGVGFEKIKKHEMNLREMLFREIKNISQIELMTEDNLVFGPILSFFCEEIEAHDISIILEDLGKIHVRSGALCAHLFMNEIKRDSILQISTHLYNTKEEIKAFNEILHSIMDEI